jgi:signal peptidase I
MVKSPVNPKVELCKRIIALPGEITEVDGEQFYVPEGHVWVEGDNKRQSMDSRNFGPVPVSLLQGRVAARLWPIF